MIGLWMGTAGLVRLVSQGWPWWASLIVVLACLAVYICSDVATYRLHSKALDKTPPERVPHLILGMTKAGIGGSGSRWRKSRAEGEAALADTAAENEGDGG